mgnify:CR=1 FL=1
MYSLFFNDFYFAEVDIWIIINIVIIFININFSKITFINTDPLMHQAGITEVLNACYKIVYLKKCMICMKLQLKKIIMKSLIDVIYIIKANLLQVMIQLMWHTLYFMI